MFRGPVPGRPRRSADVCCYPSGVLGLLRSHARLRALACGWALALAALGVLPLHQHAERLFGADALRDAYRSAAAVHPRAPHHVEAGASERERSCDICLSGAHSKLVRSRITAGLVAPAAPTAAFAGLSTVPFGDGLPVAEARGPPGA